MFSRFLKTKPIMRNMFLASMGFSMANYYLDNRRNLCCGIIGVLTLHNDAEKVCLEGIELLQNRGYDSAGIVTFDENKTMTLTKCASDATLKIDCIEKLKKDVPPRHKNCMSGLGHTRWATCGGKTDENAHPHTDMKERIALIHNGTLDHVEAMRKDLQSKGIKLKSETDTELIAQYIGLFLDEGLSLLDSVKRVLAEKIVGTWGLLVIHKDEPQKMIVSRNGSPILVGLHNDAYFVASERIAFEKHTSNYISLNDGEILELDLKNRNEFYKNSKQRVQKIIEKTNVQVKPNAPFTYFFEQEMFEQPETLLKCMNYGARLASQSNEDCTKLGGLESHIDEISKINNLTFVACGTSFYACQTAIRFYKDLEIFNTVSAIEASEFNDYDLPKHDAGGIFVSQSGETADIYKALKVAKNQGMFTIGAVNVVGSLIATSVDCGVYLNCGREVAVPATKSFTSQIVALLMIGIWISYQKKHANKKQLRIELKNSLRQLPVYFGEVLHSIGAKCKKIAKIYENISFLMIVAQGSALPIAKEGALKIKETTYIHAESFASGEIKHGPIALINSEKPGETKVMLTILDDDHFNEMEICLSQVKSRFAHTVVITDCLNKLSKDKIDEYIEIPHVKHLTSILSVLPFQKISNEVCLLKDITPDKPRNLAKTVTVG